MYAYPLMLLCGVALGALCVWLISRSRIQQEYGRAKSEGAAELATLSERLLGKDTELRKLQEAFDREVADHGLVREQSSLLKADLEGERRAAQERKESFKQAADDLAEKFKDLSR